MARASSNGCSTGVVERPDMSETAREVVARYRAAYERANSAGIGTPEFAEAMTEVRRAWQELKAAGIEPNETWRARQQDKLRSGR